MSHIRVWGEVLGILQPEPQDEFFLLGGDSLSALAVVKRLVEWDGIFFLHNKFVVIVGVDSFCALAERWEAGVEYHFQEIS